MRKTTMHAVVLATALASGIPAAAQELNTISKVEVAGDGQKTVVVVVGSRRPTFQAYTQRAPIRVVVDLVKSRLQNVPPATALPANQLVREVRTSQMGGAGRELARVEILFA